MKRLIATLLLTAVLCLPGCASRTDGERKQYEVFAMKGPTGMGISVLMAEENTGYHFTVADTADEYLSDLIAGKFDFACVPTNLAAVLAQKAPGVYRLAAVTTLGVLSVLDRSGSVQTLSDLKGKTVVATGEGLIPELTLTYLAMKNGLRVGEDFTVSYYATPAEAGALLLSGKADVAMLPQPYATAICGKDESIRVAVDLNDEWNRVSGGESMLMTACILVNIATADADRDGVRRFLQASEASVTAVNTADDAAADAVVAAGIASDAALAKAAIPAYHLTFLTGETMQKNLDGFFAVLFEVKPSLIGGAVPTKDFYYDAHA